MILLALALACGGAAPVQASPPPAAPPAPASPRSLYDACHDRVEGVESVGECKVDADCAKAGCGQEVCVPKAASGGVVTTCEVQPCFSVLDACGCHAGRCTWTLLDIMPASPRVAVPPSDVPQ